MKKPTTNNQLGIDIAVIANKVDTIKDDVVEIKQTIKCMVPNDSEYKELKMKVDTLWDIKNKLIGYMLGAGISGGVIGSLLKGIATDVIAMLK